MLDSNSKSYENIKLSGKSKYTSIYNSIILILIWNFTFYFLQNLKGTFIKIVMSILMVKS